MKYAVLTLLITGMLTTTGCNTVQGFGQDLSNAGDGLSDFADDVRHGKPSPHAQPEKPSEHRQPYQ